MNETNVITTQNQSSLMDDIIAIRDELWAEADAETEIISGELSDTFAMLDPDLAVLHKDMKSAAAQYNHAKKTGQMTGMLKWRFESAESAYQTRLLEVRKNKLNASSKPVIDEDAQAKRELHELSMQQSMNDQFAAIRAKRLKEKRRREDSGGSWLFYFILGMWLAQINAQRLEQDRLRHAFSHAKLA